MVVCYASAELCSLGCRNDVINHLAAIDNMSPHIPTMIPMQVLAEIDSGRNPMQLTRDRLERAATENQFMNGKIQAIKVSYLARPQCVAEKTVGSHTETITTRRWSRASQT